MPPEYPVPHTKHYDKLYGFTLIELLTVVSIIVILSAMSFKLVDTVQKQSREARAKSDLDALGLACERFLLTNGVYPEFLIEKLDSNNRTEGLNSKITRPPNPPYFYYECPDEKQSSEALFLALTGWLNEEGDLIEEAKGGTSRPKGYIDIADFKLGTEGSPGDLRKQLQNLSANNASVPEGLYFVDPWKEPYLYKYPILNESKKETGRSDYLLLSKGPDKKISLPPPANDTGPGTWLSHEEAGVETVDSEFNIDNIFQGPSPAG